VNTGIVVLALLGALAPARIPAAAPDARPGTVAIGQALVAVVLVALAAAGGAILDALDVSDPNAAIAAGLVVVLTAVLDLVRRIPVPVELPAGPVAALVPLAWPLGLRPAAAVLAVAAGADGVTVGVVVGALLAAVLAVAMVVRRPGEPVRGGVQALLGVLGAAAGIDLLVDGVLAV
jgi:small neutral amino acid transporter SnatA (MarC family)